MCQNTHPPFFMHGLHTLSFLLRFGEEFLKEQYLIVDRVIPILTVVSTRTKNEIMLDLHLQQTLVSSLVYTQEEIV